RQLRPGGVLVVEDELDLAEVDRIATRRAGEEDVVGLLRPELVRAERARGPQDRVRDVRLTGAVRADDDRDPRLQANLDRVHERLEPSQLDRLEMHESGTLAGGPDTLLGRQTGERLPGRVLLGVLLRAAPADAGLLAVDNGGRGEDPVVRRSVGVQERVADAPAAAGEGLLELRLVVDLVRQGEVDPRLERGHDRGRDRLEAVLEVERRERR